MRKKLKARRRRVNLLLAVWSVMVLAMIVIMVKYFTGGIFSSFIDGDAESSLLDWYLAVICFIVAFLSTLFVGWRVTLLEELEQENPLPKPLKEAIDSNHGADLDTVMTALRDEELEYYAVFKANGDKLAEGTLLSPQSCNLTKEAWNRVRSLVEIGVHNHPGSAQSSFSPSDLFSLIAENLQRCVVVTRDFTYTMENPYYADRDHKSPDAREVKAYTERLLSAGRETCILKIFSGGLLWRQYSHHVSRRVAQRFDLKYTVEDLRLRRFKAFSVRLVRRTVAAGVLFSAITPVIAIAIY